MRPCNPTTLAPSATGRQYRPGRRPKRARRQGQIGACTDTSPPVARRATAPERANAFLFGPCTARFSFGKTKYGALAAPRAVGRGGARERAQFSPQAETEFSGLCDDDNGGCILAGQAPLREQTPPWPPFGGPSTPVFIAHYRPHPAGPHLIPGSPEASSAVPPARPAGFRSASLSGPVSLRVL